MTYDLTVFDLDGTLIDSSVGILHAAEEAFSYIGYPPIDSNDIIKCIGPPLARSLVDNGVLKEADFSEFNSKFRELYKDRYLMEVTIFPGILEMLSSLKGKTILAVATNKREDYTETLLNNLGIAQRCDIIKGTDFEGVLKKTDLIRYCMKKSGIKDPNKVVMVGDTTNDENAAEDVGTDFIGVTFGFGFECKGDVKNGNAAESVQELSDLLS